MPAWVYDVDGIISDVNVFMEGQWIRLGAFKGIHRPEASDVRVVIAGAQIIHSQLGIPLLSSVEVIVQSRPVFREQNPIRIVGVAVGDSRCRAREIAHSPLPV